MPVKQRIIDYIRFKKIRQITFTSTIGVSKGYIGAISKSLGSDVLNRISKHYPDLNIEWLLTGKGEMLNNSNSSIGNYNESGKEGYISEVNEQIESYKRGNQFITIPREVFEIINSQVDTIKSQQSTIEELVKECKHYFTHGDNSDEAKSE